MNRRFLRSLHEQHLEEISAQYERRVAFLDDVEVDLGDVAGLEVRIEAHLDALVVGAQPALELCAERSIDGDVGELFAAICVFCRQGRQDLVEATLERIQEDTESEDADAAAEAADRDEERARDPAYDDEANAPVLTASGALADALRMESPLHWESLYKTLLAHPNAAIRAAAAPAIATAGLKLGPELTAAASQPASAGRAAPLLIGLGRLREPSASEVLTQYAQQVGADEAPSATLALLRFGYSSTVSYVAGLATEHPWAASLLSICGGASHAAIIASRLAQGTVAPEEIVAAGLFGNTAVIPRLLECLEEGLRPTWTAQALYLLTAAPLHETVVEDVAEIELVEGDESVPAEPDPRDQIEVARLSEDPVAWRQWWQEHEAAFQLGKRYRLGQLASPEVCGQTLRCFVLRRVVRQRAADEIGLRYGPSIDLDVDLRAHRLAKALAGLSALRNAEPTIARSDGAWLFARALSR